MDTPPTTMKLDPSRKVAITGIMSALALAGNYALVGIPNVEISTLIFFLTAYTFKPAIAASCVLIVAMVYGTINPWGGMIPPILLAQIIGWLFTVVVGTLMSRQDVTWNRAKPHMLGFALAGMVVTIYFDIITDIAYAWVFDITFLAVILAGLPFMIVHVTSNTALFALTMETLDRSIRLHIFPVAACVNVGESSDSEEEKSRLGDSDTR